MRWPLRRGWLLLVTTLGACTPHVQWPGPAVAEPALVDTNGPGFAFKNVYVTADGQPLPMRSWLPNSHARAVIVALHGFNDYSNAWEEAGKFWASQGIATYAYDQRGFGRTDLKGLWHGGRTLAQDLTTVVRLVKARHPGRPVYVVGESMGGAVAMTAVAGDDPPPVDGIILAAPAVWGRNTMGALERGALWLFSHTLPWVLVSGQGLKITPSDNDEMLKALSRDPLVIKETRVEAIHGLVDLMDDAQQAAAGIDVPALVLYGEKDEIIRPDPTYRMIGTLKDVGGERRVAVYPEGYHMLMRDLQAKIVLADVVAWIDNHRAPLPSGADKHAVTVLAERRLNPKKDKGRMDAPGPLPMVEGE